MESDEETNEVVDHMDESDVESEDAVNAVKVTNLNLLPKKTRQSYDSAYNKFREWCKQTKAEEYTEEVLLAYFTESSSKYKSSTLWSQYSKVRACLVANDNIDISKYRELIVFLKKAAKGYRPKKSKTLTREQIEKFLKEANNEQYLMIKVALIFGITGACSVDELIHLTIDDIEDLGVVVIVKLPSTKNQVKRTFVLTNDNTELNMLDIFHKYVSLRPSHTNHRRFFLTYKAGSCSTQVVGKNTLGKIPSQIASYLGLPDASSYTGHCLRSTSATLLKRHEAWKSTTAVAQACLENSPENTKNVADKVLCDSDVSKSNDNVNCREVSVINFNNCSHLNIVINVKEK